MTLSAALRMVADQDLVYPCSAGHLRVAPHAPALLPWLNWGWLTGIAQSHVHPDPDGGAPWVDWDRVAVDIGIADREAVG